LFARRNGNRNAGEELGAFARYCGHGRLGKVLATPWRSKAFKVAEKPVPLVLAQPSTAWVAVIAPLSAKGLSIVKLLGVVPVPAILTPSCFRISRRISVIVTRKVTCPTHE